MKFLLVVLLMVVAQMLPYHTYHEDISMISSRSFITFGFLYLGL